MHQIYYTSILFEVIYCNNINFYQCYVLFCIRMWRIENVCYISGATDIATFSIKLQNNG